LVFACDHAAVSHIERLHLKYTPAQLFDIVADVERYPDFLPWVIEARVFRRHEHTIWVDMTMGTRLIRRSFTTVAQLDRPHSIDISSHDPMFVRFEQKWRFKSAHGGGTDLTYEVDFGFRSRLLQALIGGSFDRREGAMIDAFQHRAHRLYG
jgi:coenzyme Q-binding protein COQ10